MDMIGIDLKHIAVLPVRQDELGFSIGLHHHFLDPNAPLLVYDDNSQPQAALNIGKRKNMFIVAYVRLSYRDNIRMVSEPPEGWEKIIVVFFDKETEDKTWLQQ